MATQDQIINKHVASMAAEINAENAKPAEQRQREADEALRESISTELAPLLKAPSFNGARIKELTAQLGELNVKLDGPQRIINNPLQRVGTVANPTVIKRTVW